MCKLPSVRHETYMLAIKVIHIIMILFNLPLFVYKFAGSQVWSSAIGVGNAATMYVYIQSG